MQQRLIKGIKMKSPNLFLKSDTKENEFNNV